MRYWVYINGQVLERPFEKEELSSINGFTRETLICPEVVPAGQQQEWVAAHLIFEPVVEQPVFPQPQPQPLPGYYQYPQQTYQQPQAQPYQTSRVPDYVAPQPAYTQYQQQPAPVQTQFNQPLYQPEAYDPAVQTQYDAQDMFETTSYDAQTQESLLEKIDLLTKEIQDVKQKLYSLSDNLEHSNVRTYQNDNAVVAAHHHTEKEKSSSQNKKEPQAKEEDDAASITASLPPGYIDDIPEVVQEETETSSDNQILQEPETEVIGDDSNSEIKDMDTLLAGAQAVSPSEDFLQDAINTTFSNKHKKEAQIQDPNAIVDLARKENTEHSAPEQIGTVVSDGNNLSEDDIPTVEEEFDAKLSFTQANLEKPVEEEEDPYKEREPLQDPINEIPSQDEQNQPEDIPQYADEQEPLAVDIPQEQEEVREIPATEQILNEPAEDQVVAEEEPAYQEQQESYEPESEPKPFTIEPENDAADITQPATLEEVFEEQPAQEELPQEEQPLEAEPVAQEEPLSADVPQQEQEDLSDIPQEVPSAQDVGANQDDESFREAAQPQQEEQPLEAEPVLEDLPQDEPQAEPVLEEQEEAPQEPPSLNPIEDDPMNIETSQSTQESAVLEEFAADKQHLEENTKNMTSSAFDVIDNAVPAEQEPSALDELTGSGKPVLGQMPAEGEDKFLKTFTSSIEEVFLDQPTSIISDYVPPAQTSDEAGPADMEDQIAYDPNVVQPNASMMDLKSLPQQQEEEQGLKKVRRIKPAAIKTVPMVAANGTDITTGEGQPNIEEAIAELGGNSIVEKILKTFGTISGLLVVLLLFIALLAAMHIIPMSWSPAHYLMGKIFKKPAAEETASNNAVDASVAEALKEKEAKLAAAQEIIAKVKSYKLADGTTLNQKILALHSKVADQIEWTADQAVDPSYYSIAAKLPPNQEGYSLTYRFSYNTMDSSLVPTTSEANNIMQAAAAPVAPVAAPMQAPQPMPAPQQRMPVRRTAPAR